MAVRVLLALAALVSAGVHFKLWLVDDYSALDVVGPAFLLNAVAGVLIAGMLVGWRNWIPLLLAVGFGVATLGAFAISTTPMGLFGVHDSWSGVAQWTAAIAEIVLIVVGLWAARAEGYLSRRP